MDSTLSELRGRLIVSVQVMDPRSPLGEPATLLKLGQAADLANPAGFRLDGPEVVEAFREYTKKPIIGIKKRRVPGTDIYITPELRDVRNLAAAGTTIIAMQATEGKRTGAPFRELVALAHDLGKLVMADIATVDEAAAAIADGADIVGTTMHGFTPATRGATRPAFSLVETLATAFPVPVIAEGGIWTPSDLQTAFSAGAHTVVIGSAITAPDIIAQRFVDATPTMSESYPASTKRG